MLGENNSVKVITSSVCFDLGKGLGKKEDGRKQMIKVNIKQTRSGVSMTLAYC